MANRHNQISVLLLTAALLLLIVMPVPGQMSADNDEFHQLFGKSYLDAVSSPEPDDDLQLAQQLLTAARGVDNRPGLVALLCNKSYELALRHPQGDAVARQAMALLISRRPDLSTDARQRLIDLDTALFRRATDPEVKKQIGRRLVDALVRLADAQDALGMSVSALNCYQQAQRYAQQVDPVLHRQMDVRVQRCRLRGDQSVQLASISSALTVTPNDKQQLKALLNLAVIELDRPGEVLRFLSHIPNAELQQQIRYAAGELDHVPDDQLIPMGQWYEQLNGKCTGPLGKAETLARARGYYLCYLQRHPEDSDQQKLAARQLRHVLRELETLQQAGWVTEPMLTAPVSAHRWIDLLARVEPSVHGYRGRWKIARDLSLQASPAEFGTLILPVVANGSYRYQVKFCKTRGDGSVAISFPVGTAGATLHLDYRGYHGLEMVGGFSAKQQANPTRVPGQLEEDRWYTLDIAVMVNADQATVTATLDQQPLVNWSGAQRDLSVYFGWNGGLSFPAFTLGVYEASATFRQARLNVSSGDLAKLQMDWSTTDK